MVGARISEATRQRVVEAAREIGYELPSSRRLVTALDRNVIAYVVDEISTSPHPVVSFDGARDGGWESGFIVADRGRRVHGVRFSRVPVARNIWRPGGISPAHSRPYAAFGSHLEIR